MSIIRPEAWTAAPALVTPNVTEDQRGLIEEMLRRLAVYRAANSENTEYYEGEHTSRIVGMSTPPAMQSIKTVSGWPGTTVDVLEERLDWLGWTAEGDDPFGLAQVFAENSLDVDSSLAHLDALVHGVAFAIVGAGADGESSPLVTVESPNDTTVLWDSRKRRAVAALAVTSADEVGNATRATLYLPDRSVSVSFARGFWHVEDVDRHNLGRVPVVPVLNRTRSSRMVGRSEITATVKYLADNAVRTMLAMETNREFYAAPQRWMMGGDEKMFQRADGTTLSQWEAVMGRVWVAPRDDDGNLPTVGEFKVNEPSPYIKQVELLGLLLAAEAGIPSSYLGFTTANPSSADAIRAGEARLVKRAERRQKSFSRAWMEVARLALLVRDGSIPDGFEKVTCRWRDAATPTRAASADETVKLISAGVLPPDSQVTFDRLGLDAGESAVLRADLRRAQARSAIASLTGNAVAG